MDQINTEATIPPPASDSNSTEDLRPVSFSERISAMDILRGFALIGILFMNIEWFNRPISDLIMFDYELAGADFAASWLVLVFVQGKFYKLFSLLFGMGFAVMIIRAQEKGKPFGAWFTRRMVALFLFGWAHMVFLWDGDILHDYAVGGMAMLAFMYLLRIKRLQKFNTPNFIGKIATGMLLVPLVIIMSVAVYFGATWDRTDLDEKWQEQKQVEALFETMKNAYDPSTNTVWPLPEVEQESEDAEQPVDADETNVSDESQEATENQATGVAADLDQTEGDNEDDEPTIEERAQQKYDDFVEQDAQILREKDVVQNGSFWEVTEFRFDLSLQFFKNTPMLALFVLLPIFLLGYWFVASKRIAEPEQHKDFFRLLAWVGLPLGMMFNLGPALVLSHPAVADADFIKGVMYSMFFFGQTVLMLGYVGFVVLMTLKPKVRRMLGWLAPLGQMALTNYIMHSVILTTLFYGYGFGKFGEVPRSFQMYLVVAIILFQVIVSSFWLKVFRFGPLEWLWRCLTYMRLQPLLR